MYNNILLLQAPSAKDHLYHKTSTDFYRAATLLIADLTFLQIVYRNHLYIYIYTYLRTDIIYIGI